MLTRQESQQRISRLQQALQGKGIGGALFIYRFFVSDNGGDRLRDLPDDIVYL